MMMSSGLESIINESTRDDVQTNTRTCIDHCFVRDNKTKSSGYAAVITTTIADHYSILCCIKDEQSEDDNTNK
ncbi:hypothetical protein FF38_07301 [Lucilia cuprina]|uniref:Uncharacterized protein n=1 Tax=Lucilia cuprina TaxID=7375 RepID=A0A0L0BSV6_LUCCU|nr:hypothetical protein FF38_07301 [Lucilia cuprina]